MHTEFKRDMDHNYLIFHGEREADTSSYQVRMLAGNVIPSILKCRLQGMDGETLFYYDITSRQSIASMYEEKKFGKEDLQMLFGGFVQVMEEMGEYLLNPGCLLLQPEYIYLDAVKKQMGFCYLPGEERDMRVQFQSLTEYVLPKLDHQDSEAVMLGYGVYRRALEDSFHLESIKEELYQERGKDGASREEVPVFSILEGQKGSDQNEKETVSGDMDDFRRAPLKREEKNPRKKRGGSAFFSMLISCGVSAAGMLLIAAGILLGYLPRPGLEDLLMGALLCLSGGFAVFLILQKIRKSEEAKEDWREKINKKREDCDSLGGKDHRGKKEAAKTSGRGRKEENSCFEEDFWEEPEGTGEKDPPEDKKGPGTPFGRRKDGTYDRRESENPGESVFGETVVLSSAAAGPVSLVSKEPGELATIYLTEDLTVIGKLEGAADAVIPMPTVSRIHAKIRRREGEYYLTDLNSRNGTSVNGRMLRGEEEYQLQNEDEVDFAQARYIFLK